MGWSMKAIIVNGTIVPLEPVPQEWNDGTQLVVEKSAEFESDADRWAKWNELCADGDDEEDARLQEFLDQRRNDEKQILKKLRLKVSGGVPCLSGSLAGLLMPSPFTAQACPRPRTGSFGSFTCFAGGSGSDEGPG